MALFGEKYGDVVRVVTIPGLSVELCGGTHVRNTGQIALFKITSETGVAAGVRRIEAVTGPRAYELIRGEEQRLQKLGELLRAPVDGVEKRVETLLEERRKLEKRLEESLRGGGDQLQQLLAGAAEHRRVAARVVERDGGRREGAAAARRRAARAARQRRGRARDVVRRGEEHAARRRHR